MGHLHWLGDRFGPYYPFNQWPAQFKAVLPLTSSRTLNLFVNLFNSWVVSVVSVSFISISPNPGYGLFLDEILQLKVFALLELSPYLLNGLGDNEKCSRTSRVPCSALLWSPLSSSGESG